MTRWLRPDPLILFLLFGFGLYIVLDAIGFGADEGHDIQVTEAALVDFYAARGGQKLHASIAELSREELEELIDAYSREEALFREAHALGLAQGDSAIRGRLIQSLLFSMEADEDALPDPSEADLRAFLDAHRDRYRLQPTLSFVHVFFDPERRSDAEADAVSALEVIAEADWMSLGDRYSYQRSYRSVTPNLLSGEWGEAAAHLLFAEEIDPGAWFGPVASRLGVHLVRIDQIEPARSPALEDLRDQLIRDWRRSQGEERRAAKVDQIVDTYSIRVAPALEAKLK